MRPHSLQYREDMGSLFPQAQIHRVCPGSDLVGFPQEGQNRQSPVARVSGAGASLSIRTSPYSRICCALMYLRNLSMSFSVTCGSRAGSMLWRRSASLTAFAIGSELSARTYSS